MRKVKDNHIKILVKRITIDFSVAISSGVIVMDEVETCWRNRDTAFWNWSLHFASLSNRASKSTIFRCIWSMQALVELELEPSSTCLCLWIPNTWEGQGPKPKPLTLPERSFPSTWPSESFGTIVCGQLPSLSTWVILSFYKQS